MILQEKYALAVLYIAWHQLVSHQSDLDLVTARHALGADVPCAVAAETTDAEHADAAGPAAELLGLLHVAFLADGAGALAAGIDDNGGLGRRSHHHRLLHHHVLRHHHGGGSYNHRRLLMHHVVHVGLGDLLNSDSGHLALDGGSPLTSVSPAGVVLNPSAGLVVGIVVVPDGSHFNVLSHSSS